MSGDIKAKVTKCHTYLDVSNASLLFYITIKIWRTFCCIDNLVEAANKYWGAALLNALNHHFRERLSIYHA